MITRKLFLICIFLAVAVPAPGAAYHRASPFLPAIEGRDARLANHAAYDAAHYVSENVQYLGQYGGVTDAVAVQGNYAYIGIGPRLSVLDVTDPNAPALIGNSAPLGDAIQTIELSGTLAYVVNGSDGFHIMDISDPQAPFEVGFLDTPQSALDVKVSGDYAFVAAAWAGLRIIDISQPAQPVEIGFYDTLSQTHALAISGTSIFLADGGDGLRVINAADPFAPVEMGFYDTPGYANDVAINGERAYVADNLEMRIVDISDPANPVEIGHYKSIYSSAYRVEVSGNLVLIGAMSMLDVVDCSDPANPVQTGSYIAHDTVKAIAVSGDYAFLAADRSGLRIVDLRVWGYQMGNYQTSAAVSDVETSGQYAYVADARYGLVILDMADISNPVKLGGYMADGGFYAVEVAGNYAYVTACLSSSPTFYILDISDPSMPVVTGSLSTPGCGDELDLIGNYAYLQDLSGMYIIDVSDPYAPADVSFYSNGQILDCLATDGNIATVKGWFGVTHFVDISDPYSPVKVGEAVIGGINCMALGNSVYFASQMGLQIFDISDPSSPLLVIDYATPVWAYDVAAQGDYAYLANQTNGLQVVYTGIPNHPLRTGGFVLHGASYATSVSLDSSQNVYLGYYDLGFWILRSTESIQKIFLPVIAGAESGQ